MSRCRFSKTVFNASGVPEKLRCLKSLGHTDDHDFGNESKWQRLVAKLKNVLDWRENVFVSQHK